MLNVKMGLYENVGDLVYGCFLNDLGNTGLLKNRYMPFTFIWCDLVQHELIFKFMSYLLKMNWMRGILDLLSREQISVFHVQDVNQNVHCQNFWLSQNPMARMLCFDSFKTNVHAGLRTVRNEVCKEQRTVLYSMYYSLQKRLIIMKSSFKLSADLK